MNRLSGERSAYLRHAASQIIDWYPWCDEAFERAKKEDKPVFLSTGAVWCHWCHVMAQECFNNEEIAGILNENFICVKIDRDERPDIDRIYQRAVTLMGAGGGWPLSVFLTPDREPFFGGTYFPPDDTQGRPGFRNVLKAVINLYRSKQKDIGEYTKKCITAIGQQHEAREGISERSLDTAAERILAEFDPRNGGFGTAPKFPLPGAIEFLLNRHVLGRDEPAGNAVRITLRSMSRGGIYDHIGGGFHRYSTDAGWIIPHFEKMAVDNAWLLRNYIEAYPVFGEEVFREISEGIMFFVNTVLADPEGGFYTSQDADVTPDDEGGYFTWTDADLKRVLGGREYAVMKTHLLHERGAMHHDPEKRVLHVGPDAEEVVRETGMDKDTVRMAIRSSREKLLRERNRRRTPFIDKTFYTSVNGMMVTSYLTAFRVLKEEGLKEYALKSLERISEEHHVHGDLLHSGGIGALLEDYVYLSESFISAYEVTGDGRYLEKARELMGSCIERLWDTRMGGFYESGTPLLGIRLKGVEDAPCPSGNAVAIMVLLKLYHITGEESYVRYAERSLEAFSLRALENGALSGYYFASLDAYYHMARLTLHTAPGSDLSAAALAYCTPYTSVVYGDDRGYVVPCRRNVCHTPVSSPESLRDFMKTGH